MILRTNKIKQQALLKTSFNYFVIPHILLKDVPQKRNKHENR